MGIAHRVRVIDHVARELRIHLFVQPRSHEPACYLGTGTVEAVSGALPMQVRFSLARPVPPEVQRELAGIEGAGESGGGAEDGSEGEEQG